MIHLELALEIPLSLLSESLKPETLIRFPSALRISLKVCLVLKRVLLYYVVSYISILFNNIKCNRLYFINACCTNVY